MAKAEFTKEQVLRAKSYLLTLSKTDNNIANTISLGDVGLFMHPYDADKIYIKYDYEYVDKENQRIVELVNVCVTKDGVVEDCFKDGMSLRERIQFESDLIPLVLEGNDISMV